MRLLLLIMLVEGRGSLGSKDSTMLHVFDTIASVMEGGDKYNRCTNMSKKSFFRQKIDIIHSPRIEQRTCIVH
jgi:hypothetical protein